MKTSILNYGGLYVASAMFLVLLILKLTGLVGWSWWTITAPLWVTSIFDLVLVGLGLLAFRNEDNKPRRMYG